MMLYLPDATKDNADLKELARAAFQTRIHQCAPSAFEEFRAALPIVQIWSGYKVDLLLAEYLERQELQLQYVSQGICIDDTYYRETQSRAISLLSELATKGLLTVVQCRCFDEIIHSGIHQ